MEGRLETGKHFHTTSADGGRPVVSFSEISVVASMGLAKSYNSRRVPPRMFDHKNASFL
jgi:hypothetical protein